MPRIRTVKPEFFTHYDLFLAERDSKLPIRIAFQGLWCCADKEGRFKWQPEQLKLNILPYDEIDFCQVLKILIDNSFIFKYEVDGKEYGCVPTLKEHQRFSGKEAQAESKIPAPPQKGRKREVPGKKKGSTGEASGNTGREGKGVGKGVGGNAPPAEGLCDDIEKYLLENAIQFEAVCTNAKKPADYVKKILHKFHLHYVEKELYPKKPLPMIAGLMKWIINEENFSKNGHHATKAIGQTFEPD